MKKKEHLHYTGLAVIFLLENAYFFFLQHLQHFNSAPPLLKFMLFFKGLYIKTFLGREMLSIVPSVVRWIYAMPNVSITVP